MGSSSIQPNAKPVVHHPVHHAHQQVQTPPKAPTVPAAKAPAEPPTKAAADSTQLSGTPKGTAAVQTPLTGGDDLI